MLGKLTQGLCLVSLHMVCTWLIHTKVLCLVFNTGFVLGKLTQCLHLVSYQRVLLGKLT